ncbi:MAG: DUF2851 family protein [Verrucomicrobiota bacterium]|jgi:hypothetical protein
MFQATDDGFYQQRLQAWRGGSALRDEARPPEHWLQHLWRHQRLLREGLRLSDGRSVQVLHPGFWNRGPGPDFRGAILRFDDGPSVQGDVEIDVEASGWIAHGHDRNPAFRGVVLHVVWERPTGPSGLPTWTMQDGLEAPLRELAPWLEGEAPGLIPANVRGGCCAPLRRLGKAGLESLLLQAAHHRLDRKAGELTHRARHRGWEGALWEGLVGALGYRHNTWPLRCLAEWVSPERESMDVLGAQACLFGLSGLLPAQPEGPNAGHLRAMWDRWWREAGRWPSGGLPREAWRLAGLRPANHPERRVAMAGHWLASGPRGAAMVEAILGACDTSQALERVARALQPSEDAFWETHWTLGSMTSRTSPLLGRPRQVDLVVNVVLPWLWARASSVTGPARDVRGLVWSRFCEWPAGEDNAVLKTARLRLLGGERRALPRTAAMQQGFLQVAADFCDASNALCEGCGFPALVEAWDRRTT